MLAAPEIGPLIVSELFVPATLTESGALSTTGAAMVLFPELTLIDTVLGAMG